jgi:ABC-type lipoprotein export system ATPase subunit
MSRISKARAGHSLAAKGRNVMDRFHKIKSLAISGGFLDGAEIIFSDNLNAVIGGRGTGKTTILEFIRAALEKMPDENNSSRAKTMKELIQKNLGGGKLTLRIETADGMKYKIVKEAGEVARFYNERDELVPVSVQKARLFDVEIYSQNDIETTADKYEKQLDMIDKFRRQQVEDIHAQIGVKISKLKENADEMLSLKSGIDRLREMITELPEIREQLKGLQPEEGEEIAEIAKEKDFKTKRDVEKSRIGSLSGSLSDAARSAKQIRDLLLNQIASEVRAAASIGGQNSGIFEKLSGIYDEQGKIIEKAFSDIDGSVAKIINAGAQAQNDLVEAHAKQEEAYRQMFDKFEEEKGKEKRRADLATKCAALEEQEKKLKEKEKELRDKETARNALIGQLSDLRDERYNVRSEVAESINKRLSPMIKVRIEQFGGFDKYRDVLIENMKGAGFKYTAVVDKIVETISPEELKTAVQKENQQLLIERLGIDAERAHRLILQLKDTKEIYDIEVIELLDKPIIELKDGAHYKDSLSLSTGQKCTTILPILLLESENPLLIDQPEDNLDNAFVYETVVKSILEIKEKRQLIFITHNPNIPVLGEAEKVFVLESTGKEGRIKNTGTVDDTRDDIETIMEGGREAFELRRKRYGH